MNNIITMYNVHETHQEYNPHKKHTKYIMELF